eukprot:TRINITY_DN4151_c0_g1_i1.p1 TRINITY_DN4151_c0_g1~~TRINITY_DN4151_c0_g1_i1.p1  ORF type:complete len:101 (+),score=18.50 TRINITY_DN4151_c0_g1_i1:85-387(+)
MYSVSSFLDKLDTPKMRKILVILNSATLGMISYNIHKDYMDYRKCLKTNEWKEYTAEFEESLIEDEEKLKKEYPRMYKFEYFKEYQGYKIFRSDQQLFFI